MTYGWARSHGTDTTSSSAPIPCSQRVHLRSTQVWRESAFTASACSPDSHSPTAASQRIQF
jgi:hypothetical protein